MSENRTEVANMTSEARGQVYDQFSGLDVMSSTIRSWAKDKGFEEDVDALHMLVESSVADESQEKHLHDFIETLFSLAQIGLIVSELGELAEAIRKPTNDDHLPDVPQHSAEMADTIIRLLHLNGRIGSVSLDDVTRQKLKYNETRPHKHGKKA